jgi:hypothetical protein
MSFPSTLLTNAYNIVGLPTGASVSEIKKRAAHLISLAKIDESEDFQADLGEVRPLRTEAGLKHAVGRLTSVKNRLAETFFWFELATIADEIAFEKIRSGDLKSAVNNWTEHDIDTRTWLVKKNRALALFIDAFECLNVQSHSTNACNSGENCIVRRYFGTFTASITSSPMT